MAGHFVCDVRSSVSRLVESAGVKSGLCVAAVHACIALSSIGMGCRTFGVVSVFWSSGCLASSLCNELSFEFTPRESGGSCSSC